MKFGRYIVAIMFLTVIVRIVNAGDIATERTQVANGFILTLIQTAEAGIEAISGRIEELESISNTVTNWQNWPFVREVMPLVEDARNIVAEGHAIAYSMQNLEGEMMAR